MKVRVAVSPALRDVMSELMAMVGLTVSTERVTELLASEPSALVLPEASENVKLATEMTASAVLSVVGVKVAEWEVPDPEKSERVPPEIEISDALKLVEASEREKVMDAVSPAEREEVFEERETVGGVVSAVVVSMVSVRELSGSAPSVLRLPAASEKTEEATEIRPSDVLLALGVNVAV